MSKRYARQLHSADGLIAAVEQYGFLPFFRNEIHGFSIEELCPPELWFADDVDRGSVGMERTGCAERQMSLRQTFQQEGWICESRVDSGLCELPA